MSSRKKSSPSDQDARRGQVVPTTTSGSDPQPSLEESRKTEVRVLVSSILSEIARYEANSLDYRIFEPLETEHPLRRLVSRLCDLDPNAFESGSQGKPLWRKLVQSSVVPSEVDYLGIFDDLEAFETWLVQNYGLGSTSGIKVDEYIHHATPRQVPFPNLSVAQFQVLKSVDDVEPRFGYKIAERAGYEDGTVRRILARFVERGYIQKTKRGYIRLCSLSEHKECTPAAQTFQRPDATI